MQILCHASPFAKVLEEVSSNIKYSGLGFLTTWALQQIRLEPLSMELSLLQL